VNKFGEKGNMVPQAKNDSRKNKKFNKRCIKEYRDGI